MVSMNYIRYFLLLSLLPLALCDTNIPYETCGNGHVTITNAQANIWPPQPGQTLKVIVNGTLDEEVTAGDYHYTVYFDGIQIQQHTGSISELVQLPAKVGAQQLIKSATVPSAVPSGEVKIKIEAHDSNQQLLVCLVVTAHVDNTINFDMFNEVLDSLEDDDEPTAQPTQLLLPLDYVSEPHSIPYTICDDQPENNLAQLLSLQSTLFPPKVGEKFSLIASVKLNEIVNDGSFNAIVTWNHIQVMNQHGSLASLLSEQLPAQPGIHTITKDATIPTETPSGLIGIKVNIKDSNEKHLICVNVEFNL